jgi:hypothetical protein
MIIDLNEDAELKVVIKGDTVSKPLDFCDWSAGKTDESGVLISLGHRGERGAFLSKSLLNKLIREIRKREKEIKKNDNNNNP